MAQTILERIGSVSPAILSGDFNVDERTDTIGMIRNKLENVFAGERTTSFNLRQKGNKGGFGEAVVDHLFVSRDVIVLEHDMPDVNVSDHQPLMCVFEVASVAR